MIRPQRPSIRLSLIYALRWLKHSMRISTTKRAAVAALAGRLNESGRSDAVRVIVPGYVCRRRLTPPLTCLSTPADRAAAAALRDVSSSSPFPVSSAGSTNISWPAVGRWIAAVIADRAEQTSLEVGTRGAVQRRRRCCRLGATNSSCNCGEPRRQDALPLSLVLTSSVASVSYAHQSQITAACQRAR